MVKKSRPLEEAYGKDFEDGFAGMARQFAEHFKEKGWTRTEFQFLLNNKYYYRARFFGNRGRQGTSFWLLDEPWTTMTMRPSPSSCHWHGAAWNLPGRQM